MKVWSDVFNSKRIQDHINNENWYDLFEDIGPILTQQELEDFITFMLKSNVFPRVAYDIYTLSKNWYKVALDEYNLGSNVDLKDKINIHVPNHDEYLPHKLFDNNIAHQMDEGISAWTNILKENKFPDNPRIETDIKLLVMKMEWLKSQFNLLFEDIEEFFDHMPVEYED